MGVVSCCFISGREQRHTTNSSAICWRGLNSFIAHPLTLYSYQLKMRVHVFVLLATLAAVMEAAPRSQFYHYPANSYYPGATANSYYSPSFHQYPNYYANPYANHQRGPARPSLFNGFNTFNGFQDFQLPPNPLRFIYNQFSKQVAKPIISFVAPTISNIATVAADEVEKPEIVDPEEAEYVAVVTEETPEVLDGLSGGVAQAQFNVVEAQEPVTESEEIFTKAAESVTEMAETVTEMAEIEPEMAEIEPEPIAEMDEPVTEIFETATESAKPVADEISSEEESTDEEISAVEESISEEESIDEEISAISEEISILEESVADEIATELASAAEEITTEEAIVADEIVTEEAIVADEIATEEAIIAEEIVAEEVAVEDKPEEIKPVEDKTVLKPESASLTIESSNNKASNVGQIHDEIIVSTGHVQIAIKDTEAKPEPVAAVEPAEPTPLVSDNQHKEQLVLLGPPSEIEKIADVAATHGEDCKVDYVVIEEGSDQIKDASPEQIKRIKAHEEKLAKAKETRFDTRLNSRGRISIVFNTPTA